MSVASLVRLKMFRSGWFIANCHEKSLPDIGLMDVPINSKLAGPHDRLYELLIDDQQRLDMARLGHEFHVLAEQMLHYESPSTNRIGGVTDLDLLLNSLLKSGGFSHNANRPSGF